MVAIREIRAAPVVSPRYLGRQASRPAAWLSEDDSQNPLSRYPTTQGWSDRTRPPWPDTICVVTTDDGTWGLGVTPHAGPVVPLINDYFAPLLRGEVAIETERLWDLMARCSAAYFGASGIASCAMSAVDLALWDLRGKLHHAPIYELIGGPARDEIRCYATGNDVDNYLEHGFTAVKLSCQWGVGAGPDAIDRIEELVAASRHQVGEGRSLMLDLWGVQDADFTIQLAERLEGYQMVWLEDFVYPDAWDDYLRVRRAIPEQPLAAGEKWYTHYPFQLALELGVVDVLQPDLQWVGGMTPVIKIAQLAENTGVQIAPHLGANDNYGQHACLALPGCNWGEFFVDVAPGEDLGSSFRVLPGTCVPANGVVRPSDKPGFGIEVGLREIAAATSGSAD